SGASDPRHRRARRCRRRADPRRRRGRRRCTRRGRRHGCRPRRPARPLGGRHPRGRAAHGGVARPRLPPGARRGARPPARGSRMRLPSSVRLGRTTSFLFLASLFCVTFEKIHWDFVGTVSLADVLAILFLLSFAISTTRVTVPRTTVVLIGFFCAFLIV